MYECCLISIVQIFWTFVINSPLKVVWRATPFAKWRKGLVALVYPTRSNGMYDAIFASRREIFCLGCGEDIAERSSDRRSLTSTDAGRRVQQLVP